jgi:hypothetical protein
MSLLSSLSPTVLSKSALTVTAVTVAMLVAVACAKPKEEPLSQMTITSAAVRALASCDTIAETGSCTDYSSPTGSFQLERSLCRSAQGGFALNSCPSAGRIGACAMEESEVKRYYAGERGFTVETARKDCEQSGLKGRFVSPPDGFTRDASGGLAAR